MESTNNQCAWNVIDGAVVGALNDASRVNVAPATGEDFGRVVVSEPADVSRAVDAAVAAAPEWSAAGVDERRRRLMAWAAAVRQQSDVIARIDAIDSGTPVRTMRAGVTTGADYVEYYAQVAIEATGDTIPATPDNLHFTVLEPFGAVGVIIPFNHPAYFSMSKTGPALAAGNTVVLKPAEQTPRSASVIVEAAQEHLGPGVLNLIHGGPEVGAALVVEPRIRRVHFTGGVSTGLAVQAGAASSGVLKYVTMELGGKNPLIVYPDVDLDIAAEAAVTGMNYTRNQGQSCGSTSRLFAHTSVAVELGERIAQRVAAIELGLPQDEDTEMGSLVSTDHQQHVLKAIQQARADGATVLTGGGTSDAFPRGAYVQPTVLTGVDPSYAAARDEIFGPVLSVLEWEEEPAMIEAVNDSRYGLTAAIYTDDVTTALRCARAVEVGYVWVNGVEKRWKGVPFGGYKDSGLGSEHSLDELRSFTRTKAVNVMLSRTQGPVGTQGPEGTSGPHGGKGH